MWKLSQVLLYAILIVEMPSGADARGEAISRVWLSMAPRAKRAAGRRGPGEALRAAARRLGTGRQAASARQRRVVAPVWPSGQRHLRGEELGGAKDRRLRGALGRLARPALSVGPPEPQAVAAVRRRPALRAGPRSRSRASTPKRHRAWQRQVPDSGDSTSATTVPTGARTRLRLSCRSWRVLADRRRGRAGRKVHQIALDDKAAGKPGALQWKNTESTRDISHWGYVGSAGNFLVGSAVKSRGILSRSFGAASSGTPNPRARWRRRFAANPSSPSTSPAASGSGARRGENIINTTITLSPRKAFFVESPRRSRCGGAGLARAARHRANVF